MNWDIFIKQEKNKGYFKHLNELVDYEYSHYKCYPTKENIFNALNKTPYDNVKVIILGQDPYHEENQAHGLAFSVLCEKLPPSLKNIYKEMESDLNVTINQDGDLTYLAEQGVLLLNTTLTVREHKANSHSKFGWNIFTDNIISSLQDKDNVVYILWGNNARSKKNLITNKTSFIIESEHPSPLSAYRGFFGSKPFSRTNEFLKEKKISEIKWYK